MILCAAPAYASHHGLPSSPQELVNHHWLAFERDTVEAPKDNAVSTTNDLPLRRLDLHGASGERQRVHVGVRIASNNYLALQQMCEQGLGIAPLPYTDVLPSLERGTLVRLLPGWRFTPIPVTAVTLRRDGEPAKVRVAMEALKRYFATVPGIAPAESAADFGSSLARTTTI